MEIVNTHWKGKVLPKNGGSRQTNGVLQGLSLTCQLITIDNSDLNERIMHNYSKFVDGTKLGG